MATIAFLAVQAQGQGAFMHEVPRVYASQKTTHRKPSKRPRKDKDFVVPDFSLYDDKKKKDQKMPDDFDGGKASKKFCNMKGQKEFKRPQIIGKSRPRPFNSPKGLVRF